MTETLMTSRDANQDFSRAKRAARNGPVIITERGKPSQVLLSYEDYSQLKGAGRSILASLAQPDSNDFELELLERRVEPFREIEFE